MRTRLSLFIAISLTFAFIPQASNGQQISECRIKPSNEKHVSLGFPVNPERLSQIKDPKILVIPYRLKNESGFSFGSREKELFLQASDKIYKYSGSKSRVTFKFNDVINVDMTVEQRNLIKAPNNSYSAWQERYDNSTWGFMKNFILSHDKEIDFTGFDAVVLFSNTKEISSQNAEAMMMTRDIYGPWFTPISTNEGPINNVLVLYNQNQVSTFTHEILHLYGLIDLYGSISGPANSIMKSTKYDSLLAWEQWVLGWLPDQNVKCLNESDLVNSTGSINTFIIDYSQSDQVLAIPTGPRSSLNVDVISVNSRTFLNYYTLDNDASPPIKSIIKDSPDGYSIEITGNLGIGTYIKNGDLAFLISDNDGKKIAINIFPIKLFFSESGKQLQNTVDLNRTKYLKIEEQKTATSKKTTITCVKGKITKKVTAVKPVCPKGYSKK